MKSKGTYRSGLHKRGREKEVGMEIKGQRINSYDELDSSRALEYASWGGSCSCTCSSCTCCSCASVEEKDK